MPPWWRTDRSVAALAVATRNAARLLAPDRRGGPPQWFTGDWFAALPATLARFDVIVSNPPYIARRDAHLTAGDLRFEPRGALTDEADGLQATDRDRRRARAPGSPRAA